MVSPLCPHISAVSWCIQIPSSYEGTSQDGLGPILRVLTLYLQMQSLVGEARASMHELGVGQGHSPVYDMPIIQTEQLLKEAYDCERRKVVLEEGGTQPAREAER